MKHINVIEIINKYGFISDSVIGLYRLYNNIYYYNDEKSSIIINSDEINQYNIKKYKEEHIYDRVNIENRHDLDYIKYTIIFHQLRIEFPRLIDILNYPGEVKITKLPSGTVEIENPLPPRNSAGCDLNPLIQSVINIMYEYDHNKILILDRYYIENRIKNDIKNYPKIIEFVRLYKESLGLNI